MENKIRIVLAAVLAAQLGACGMFGGKATGEWSLKNAEKVPAAAGQVRVAKGEQGNSVVTIRVEHLAHPGEAFPGTSTYVVWLIPNEGERPQNVGALQVDSELKGELTTNTPYRSFRIVVTAENEPNATQPSDNRAMTASIALPG
jgi:hypothetical protein